MTEERRQSPSERQHEALMALATKMNPRAAQTFSAKRVTIGDLKGSTIMDGYTCPKHDDETFAAWRERMEHELSELDAMLLRVDAGRIKRELEASTA